MPISIERLNGEFLLHYSEFSFFVNRNGWRARPDWLISWEGKPVSFALSHPYLLAFDPSFIEIRHLETSVLVHIITGKNIRMLHSSTREVCPPKQSQSHPLNCLIVIPDPIRLRRRRRPRRRRKSRLLVQATTPITRRHAQEKLPPSPSLRLLSPCPKNSIQRFASNCLGLGRTPLAFS